jgi:hypothetical protein
MWWFGRVRGHRRAVRFAAGPGGRSAPLRPNQQIAGRTPEGRPFTTRAKARVMPAGSRIGPGPVGHRRRDGADQPPTPATTQGDLEHGY